MSQFNFKKFCFFLSTILVLVVINSDQFLSQNLNNYSQQKFMNAAKKVSVESPAPCCGDGGGMNRDNGDRGK